MSAPKLFIGNWKMYLSDAAAEQLARTYLELAEAAVLDVAVAPSFTALDRVGRALGRRKVSLAAQDVFWMDGGAYTGEVSPPMLAELGVRHVIVGHSERRAYLGETDAMAARKAKAAADAGLVPVVCVGETAEERAAGRQDAVVRSQVEAAFSGLAPSSERPAVVAYEPRWAIGSGTPCRPEDVVLMHGLIRQVIEAMKGAPAAGHVRVLYGGSVDPSNLMDYLDLAAVDGALVGKASTRAEDVRAMFKALTA